MLSIVAIEFTIDKIENFKEIISIYQDDKDKAIEQLIDMIVNNQMQEKSYYANLFDFGKDDLVKHILSNRQIIESEYKINKISLFGSFANYTNRIDSDVDIVVRFKEDITYDDKVRCANSFKEMMLNKFHRFVDIVEEVVFSNLHNEDIVYDIF